MESLYKEHFKLIQKVFSLDVVNHLNTKRLKPKKIEELLESLSSIVSSEMLIPLKDNLEYNLSSNEDIFISYHSLVAYLTILINSKINQSPIAIDKDSGIIIVFYNEQADNYKSTKITLQCNNLNEYVYSIIDREDTLVKLSGKFNVKDNGHYKIENLINIFQ